ncbi:MAG TPA: PQQ-binding-like beta-propeller repeat protein [Vicinamibacterales bacterium]|jgi:outer membrane protein assembly factor BamB
MILLRRLIVSAVLLSGAVTLTATDVLIEGVDTARTGWVKDEKVFTLDNVGSTTLRWRVQLNSTSRSMHNLFPPLIAENVMTTQGQLEVGLVAGVTDDLFALNVATGQVLWRRRFENRLPNQAPVDNVLCPGGQTAVPAMVQVSPGKYTVYAVSWDGRLHQINLADGEDVAPPEKFVPGNGKAYALNYKDGVIYTATAQGCGGLTNAFHSFDLGSRRASTFIPAGGGLWGRRGAAIDADGRVYLGTGDGIFDPEHRRLGNGIVSVKIDVKKTLQLVDFFAAPNANWLWRRDLDVNTTPVVIDYRGRKFLVGTSKECRLWLLDREGLGGEDHRSTMYTTPLICADSQAFDGVGVWGALSAWQDRQGTQWVLVPFWGPVSTKFKAPIEHSRPRRGGVAALRLEEAAGKWQLAPAWLSRDMDMAEETVIANGIVFAYSSGVDGTQTVQDAAWNEPGGPRYGGALSSGAARRIPNSRRAMLYALDGQTGKELWNSGDTITSWNHFSGITVANGRIYIGTWDGMLYAFGVR